MFALGNVGLGSLGCIVVLGTAPLSAQSPAEFLGEIGLHATGSSGSIGSRSHPDFGNVVEAENYLSGALAAVDRLRAMEGGIQFGRVAGELAIFSGTAFHYGNGSADPRLVSLSRRSAILRAATAARVQLLNHVQGMTLAGRSEIADALQQASSGTSETAASRSVSVESLLERSAGLLSGVTVVSMEDDADAESMFVTVMLTPSTWVAGCGASVNPSAQVDDIDAAIAGIWSEVRHGTIPPSGGRLLVDRQGGLTWVGIGSSVCFPADGDAQPSAQQIMAARKMAERKSRGSLLKTMQGEVLHYESELGEGFADAVMTFEDLSSGASRTQFETSSQQMSVEATASVSGGQLPPGCVTELWSSGDRTWHFALSIYPSRPAATRSASPDQARAAIVAEVGASAQSVVSIPAASPADACESEPERGINRSLASGQGVDRRAAIKQALLEGVEACNGVALKGSSVQREIYRDAIKDLNGQIDRVVEAETESLERIETESNGIISGYKVLQEGQDASGIWTVRVCVEVPIFDPARPRPGKRLSVAILPFHVPSRNFEVHGMPGGLEPGKVISEFTAEFSKRFAAPGEFTVIERQHLADVDGEMGRIRSGIASGDLGVQEQVRFGQRIGVDFVLVGSVDNLEHRFETVYNRVRRANEPRESLTIKSSARLVSVATQQVVAAQNYERLWDLIELSQLPANKASLTRETFACREVISAIAPELIDSLMKLKAAAVPRVLEEISAKEVVLEYVGPELKVGTLFNVYRISKKASAATGKVRELKSLVGKIRVQRSDSSESLVYCEVIERSIPFQEGDVCDRR